MDQYSLAMAENRKVALGLGGLNIKPNTSKPTKPTCVRGEEIPYSSVLSKDKKSSGSGSRRNQRHSTEIGAEYYRWWAVRSSLGFQTNEHIAGLLLDGFYALLQHLVVSCGGEEYSSKHENKSGGDGDVNNHNNNNTKRNKSDAYTYTSGFQPSSTSLSSSSSSFSSSSSSSSSQVNTRAFTSSFSSPPGAEEMEGFNDFNNAISFYTNSLWCMCAQPDSGLHKLNASPALQDFIVRLIGYIRGGRGFTLTDRKRQLSRDGLFSSSSSSSSHVNSSVNFHLMNLTPRPMTDLKTPFVSITHSGGLPCLPSNIPPGLAPLVLQTSNVSAFPPNSSKGGNYHVIEQNSDLRDAERYQGGQSDGNVEKGGKHKDDVRNLASDSLIERMTETAKDLTFSGKRRQLQSGKNSPGPLEEPPNFLKDEPSKSAVDAECSYGSKPDSVTETREKSLSEEISLVGLPKCRTNDTPIKGNDASTLIRDKNTAMKGGHFTWTDQGPNLQFIENRYGSSYANLSGKVAVQPPLNPSFSNSIKDKDVKGYPYAPTQGTPLLFFPAQTMPGQVGPVNHLPGSLQRLVYNSPVRGLSGHNLSTSNTNPNHRSRLPALSVGDLVPYSGQMPLQRHSLMPLSTTASKFVPPILSSRMSTASQPSMVPIFYSPAVNLPLRMQTASISWASDDLSLNSYNTKQGSANQSPFGCNQNNTMRDNFSLYKIYQDTSCRTTISGPHHPDTIVSPADKMKDANPILPDEHFYFKRNHDHDPRQDPKSTTSGPVFPQFLNDQDNALCHPNLHSKQQVQNSDTPPCSKNDGDSQGREFREKRRDVTSPRLFQSNTHQDGKEIDTGGHNGNGNTCLDTANEFDVPSFSPMDCKKELDQPTNNLLRPPANDALRNILMSRTSREGNGSSEMSRSTSTVVTTSQKPLTTIPLPLAKTTKSTVPFETSQSIPNTTPFQTSNEAKSHELIKRSNPKNNDTVSRATKSFKSRRFSCNTCNVVFDSGTDLLVHRYEQHSYVCGECDGRFLSTAKLQQHKESDHPQMRVCSHCRFSSFCQDTMDAHKRSKHSSLVEERPATDTTKGETVLYMKGGNTIGGVGKPILSQEEDRSATSTPVVTYEHETNVSNQRHDRNNHEQPTSITKQSHDSTFIGTPTDKHQMKGLFCGNVIVSGPNPSSSTDVNTSSNVFSFGRDKEEHRRKNNRPNMCFPVGTPCPGSVFPSFNRTIPHHMTSSKVDNIVSMFSQVSDFCRFEPSRFLTPMIEDPGEMMECKESILVIDTDRGGVNKDTDAENNSQNSSSLQNRPCETGRNKRKLSHPTPDDSTNRYSQNSAIPTEGDVKSINVSATSNHDAITATDEQSTPQLSQRLPTLGRPRKKKRKAPSVKNSIKKCKTTSGNCTEAETLDDNQHSVVIGEGTHLRTSEKNAQNSSIKTHRVWLDDFRDSRGMHTIKSDGNDRLETWTTLQPIVDNGHNNNNSFWKISHKSRKRNRDISPGGHSQPCEIREKQEYDADTKGNDSINARVLSLRERHRSHSLPPKKRGIRKVHPEANKMLDDNENTAQVEEVSFQTRSATCPVKELL